MKGLVVIWRSPESPAGTKGRLTARAVPRKNAKIRDSDLVSMTVERGNKGEVMEGQVATLIAWSNVRSNVISQLHRLDTPLSQQLRRRARKSDSLSEVGDDCVSQCQAQVEVNAKFCNC